jgi:hypothetical protein
VTKKLIIAPHIDDELIGCYSVLANSPKHSVTILFRYELTEERKRESGNLKNFFPSVAVLVYATDQDLADRFSYLIEEADEVYVPSRRDGHADHRKVNAQYRKHATHFYSVDMEGGAYIGDEASKKKHHCLNMCYPSQKSLWETNAKYYLFEAISKIDYQELVKHTFGADFTMYEVTFPREYYGEVRTAISSLLADPTKITDTVVFNLICSICHTGKVVVDCGKSILETW